MPVELSKIIRQFEINGDYLTGAPYGNGHINDTYAIQMRQNGQVVRYILQRINHNIFKNIPGLMGNIQRVTEHLRDKLQHQSGHNPDRETLTIIPTQAGGSYHQDAKGNYWRAYIFIEGAHTVEVVEKPLQAYEAARAFGRFQHLLADLPSPRLFDTIPDFHHTPKRFHRLQEAITRDVRNRAAEAGPEIRFALARESMVSELITAQAVGKLPERITHNDTKINNVMLDDLTGQGTAVIDLDTVMPGLVLYDFGDQVRTSTCTGTEDETDLSQVTFRLELFEALIRGYLEAAGGFLTTDEIDYLAFSGILITFEIGIRFLADFLEGDVYFKIHRPGQNLQRARTQFARVSAMEAAAAQMTEIVTRCRS